MGFSRPAFRAAVAAASASALIASGLAFSGSAFADPAYPTPVSGTALPTAQVNGVVWTQTVSNGIDYVGGSFTQSQPAGAAVGMSVTGRSNLFAYDVTTGVAVPGFGAVTNAQVRGIAASQDGSRIYIVGDFTTVNGQARNHIAALDRSGKLVAGFAPSVNGQVLGIATHGSLVYFGGTFSSVNGVARSRAAAVSASGGLLPFAPNVGDYTVRAIALSPDGARALLGGNFSTVNSKSSHGLAAVDATTGQSVNWAANAAVNNWGSNAAIFSLSTRGAVVYATGYSYMLDGGTGSGNLEGAVAMNWADGSIKWLEDCHGDSYSSYPFNDALYVASHAHNCANVVGGWSAPGVPTQWRRAQAFSQSAVGVLAHNTDNYQDWGGFPSPRLVPDWSPAINTGTYTGSDQGAWSVAGGGSYVVFGGEFTKVNGQRQAGLVRFKGSPELSVGGPVASPTPTPTPTTTTPAASAPNRVSKPRVAVLGPSRIAVKWTAPKAAKADRISGFVVKAYMGGKVVKTINAGASRRLVTVGGLRHSTSYRIAVAAKNAAGTGRLSVSVSARTKEKGANVSATKRPGQVRKPTATSSATRVRVRWLTASTSGALGVSRYQIRLVLHGKTVKTTAVSAKARTTVVAALKRQARYGVSVRAENWAGWGLWSAARAVRTR